MQLLRCWMLHPNPQHCIVSSRDQISPLLRLEAGEEETIVLITQTHRKIGIYLQ